MKPLTHLKNYIYKSKGFLTAKNGWIDYKEWHTAVSGAAVMYVSPVLWALIIITLVRKEKQAMGSFAEYKQEVPYWLIFGLSTGLYTGFSGRLDASLISFLFTLG
jgi:hypothetical protein